MFDCFKTNKKREKNAQDTIIYDLEKANPGLKIIDLKEEEEE